MRKRRCKEQKFNKNYNRIAQEKSTINRVTISQVVLCVSVPELSCDTECWLCPTCDSSRGCPRIVSIISSNTPRSLFYPSRITPRDSLYHNVHCTLFSHWFYCYSTILPFFSHLFFILVGSIFFVCNRCFSSLSFDDANKIRTRSQIRMCWPKWGSHSLFARYVLPNSNVYTSHLDSLISTWIDSVLQISDFGLFVCTTVFLLLYYLLLMYVTK